MTQTHMTAPASKSRKGPCYGERDDAVSPVVGVMLMLVVTIIVAAVVSSFATALPANVGTASNAQVELVGVSSGGYKGIESVPAWSYGKVGVVFKNAGGDSLDLRNLKFYVTGLGKDGRTQGAVTMTYNDAVSPLYVEDSGNQHAEGRYAVTLPKEVAGYRMQRFGSGLTPEELKDPVVEPGERFIVYCEAYSNGERPSNYLPHLGFRIPRGGDSDWWSRCNVMCDGGSKYTLSDIKTGVVYSEGFLEPEHVF